TQFDCYVANFYVQTGTSGYVAARCNGGGGGGQTCSDLNSSGIDLIKGFEGFVARPALDPVGLPTVGYGHLCQSRGCGEAPFSFPLSPTTATELLHKDIPRYTWRLASSLTGSVTFNKNQWRALTSWIFNIRRGATRSSSLIK
ncbi:hypothetical protein BGW38_005983, partial [Lunasporangiospora selenospora]